MHRTLLLIDDNEEDCYAVQRLLGDHPTVAYHVEEASTGAEGLEQWDALDPDCVVLDYHLPDMKGPAFMEALLHSGQDVRAPVLVLTGNTAYDAATQMLSMGATAYLSKAVLNQPDRLFGAIDRAIDTFELRRFLLRNLASLIETHTFFCEQLARLKKEPILSASGTQAGADELGRVLHPAVVTADEASGVVRRAEALLKQQAALIDAGDGLTPNALARANRDVQRARTDLEDHLHRLAHWMPSN